MFCTSQLPDTPRTTCARTGYLAATAADPSVMRGRFSANGIGSN